MDHSSRYPLTPIQQGMLFHYLSDPESGIDVEQVVWTLAESVDEARFSKAWSDLSFPVLRSTFHWAGPEASFREVQHRSEIPFTSQDWAGLSTDEQASRFEAFLETDRKRPVSLDSLPNTRVALIRLGEDDYRCVWTYPHILLDGRSIPRVLREVTDRYHGRFREVTSTEPFDAFVDWLDRRDTSGALAFWKGHVEHISEPTRIPNLGVVGSVYGKVERKLSARLSASIRDTADTLGVSTCTIVHGAWSLLLSRYGGSDEVVFGSTQAGRKNSIEGAQDGVGVFLTTIPVVCAVGPTVQAGDWIRSLHEFLDSAKDQAHASLGQIQQLSGVRDGQALLDSLLVFDHGSLKTRLTKQGWVDGAVELHERLSYPIVAHAFNEEEIQLRLSHDGSRMDDTSASRLLLHWETLLAGLVTAATNNAQLASLSLLTDVEVTQRRAWNRTSGPIPAPECLHTMFEAQVDRTPDAIAVVAGSSSLTYRELDRRSNRVAHTLLAKGVEPESLIGVATSRSTHMMVALLGTLKAGAAYVPIDLTYPPDRIDLMVRDSGVGMVLTETHLVKDLPRDTPVLPIDEDESLATSEGRPQASVDPSNLAYVIYTSGSTGRPKGVEVEHRNVANFFAGMDAYLAGTGTWLAVTSLSFDISVLELFWTLARGFKVVLYTHQHHAVKPAETVALSGEPLDLSLFYFSSDEGNGSGSAAYKLLLDGARFADKNGFKAVWTPERHFHAFGGLYPNPAVTGSAVAAITENVHIRTGSLVLPLHHPIRVAEDWAVIDNISDGRVGLAFASGWHPEDFCIRPDNYEDRKAYLYEAVDTVRSLWRGEEVTFPGPRGDVSVRTLPRPVQPELPVWITTAGSIDSYISAGRLGAGVLTHLLGQKIEDLGAKITAYREAWKEAGHPGEGHIALMLHTFVGEDDDEVREIVRAPMVNYLRSAMSLVKGFAGEWEAYSKKSQKPVKAEGDEFDHLSEEDAESLLQFAFERYYQTSGLFGSRDKCLAMIEDLKAVGVNEIACLIDFGVDHDLALKHLNHLAALRVPESEKEPESEAAHEERETFAELVERHGVTHLQCTPTMMQMLRADTESAQALQRLSTLLLGGEALPGPLAKELCETLPASILNMYGPTETTIWSSAFDAREAGDDAIVPIGSPILNTEFEVVDQCDMPVPVGVPGELLIGGSGVVRGYLNRPELTKERFIHDPRSEASGARLYRTGDQVRYRADGVLEFLGRIDSQVKIRGHRIELGEIEAAMKTTGLVQTAVVVPRKDASGGNTLAAYFVPTDEEVQEPAGALRDALATRLPEVMVPASFTRLEALPTTPNGKIDRKALPAPDEVGSRVESAAPPATQMEEAIAEIWKEELGVSAVGVDQNFFDLGGHSLLAVQVHLRIQKALERTISITDLFRFPTVRSLAGFLGGATDDEDKGQASLDRAQRRRQSMGRRRLKRQKAD